MIISKILFNDIVSIVIGIAYEISIFENANNIEIVYLLAYQKIIRDGNYLELSEEKIVIQLLSYIENTLYLKPSRKEKNKETGDIILLILSIGTEGSVSLILPAY